MTRIVGICLVRNEDRFLERVLANALPFCDDLLVADHQSRDGTAPIVRRLAASENRIQYHRIRKPSESHTLIESFAGTDTWVFAVDGDEIYDPGGLSRFRQEILSGNHAAHWQVLGNVLHCDELSGEKAHGYLARPSRSMTKLYNFAAIESWAGPCSERLHGGTISFRPGFDAGKRLRLDDGLSFEESPFRCLHTVFLPRSSRQPTSLRARPNIAETIAYSPFEKVRAAFLKCLGRSPESRGKHASYRRGERVEVNVSAFFPPL